MSFFRFLIPVLLLTLLLGCAAQPPVTEPAPTAPAETAPVQTAPPQTEPAAKPAAQELLPGYTGAVRAKEGFLAVGTGGRLDAISEDGTVTQLDSGTDADLTAVWTDGDFWFVSGTKGTLLISRNGRTFAPVKLDTEADVCGAVRFDGEFYAATADGVILFSPDMARWSVEEEYPFGFTQFVSMDYGMAIINDRTDVLFTIDGMNWEHQNFNEVYDGLYPKYVFTRLVGAGQTFFVLGYEQDDPRLPLVMFTETGEVWMQKAFNEIDGVSPEPEDAWRVNDLEFSQDQILSACTEGRLLTIPECSVCNKSFDVEGAKTLTGIVLSEAGNVLVVGEDFFSRVIDGTTLRQDHIKAEQARKDVEEKGAIIIDVREQSELEQEGFIPGSLHIPVGEIEERLYDEVVNPSTELIFYCKAGVRAQTALETAAMMGYANVYNLGGLSDWPYEIAHFEDEQTEP